VKRLYVLYDQECALCQNCRAWLMRQPAYLELQFIPLQSPEIARRFPGLQGWDGLDLSEKLVVVSDEGALYQGQNAWIMCLYALRDYRKWAFRLADPALLPLARRLCDLVSRNRLSLSRFLKEPAEKLAREIKAAPPEFCATTGGCDQ
jgi:predicted DCC family thiol-disulfide oxidoreductase YuxK